MGWGRKEKHILLNLSSLKLYVWKQNRYITTGIFGPDNLFMQKPRIQRAVAPICLISAAAEVKWSQASPCPTPELLGSLWEKHQSRTWFPTSRALPRPVASVGANSLLLDKQCPRESGPHWGVRSKGGPEVDGGVSRLWGWPPGKTSDCTRGRWKKGVGKTAEPSGGQRNRCRDPRLHKRAWMGGEMGRQRADLKFWAWAWPLMVKWGSSGQRLGGRSMVKGWLRPCCSASFRIYGCRTVV